MRKQRLQWFGHVEKTDDERVLAKAKNFVVDGSKKGKPTPYVGLATKTDQSLLAGKTG